MILISASRIGYIHIRLHSYLLYWSFATDFNEFCNYVFFHSMDRFVGAFNSCQFFSYILLKWTRFLCYAHLVTFSKLLHFSLGLFEAVSKIVLFIHHLEQATACPALGISLFLVFVLLLCILVSRVLSQMQTEGKMPFHFSCQVIPLLID